MTKLQVLNSWEDRPLLAPSGISQEDWDASFDDYDD